MGKDIQVYHNRQVAPYSSPHRTQSVQRGVHAHEVVVRHEHHVTHHTPTLPAARQQGRGSDPVDTLITVLFTVLLLALFVFFFFISVIADWLVGL